MNSLFSIVFGIPSIICSFGGIISFIWLIVLGEWVLPIAGIFFAWFARLAIGFINLLPSAITIFGSKLQKKNAILSIVILLIGISLSYTITYLWSYNSACIILDKYHGNIIPHLLFTFSFIMAPFIDMQDKTSPVTTIHILSALLGSFVMLMFVLVYGYSPQIIDRGAMYMAMIFALTIIVQTYFVYYLSQETNGEEEQFEKDMDRIKYNYEHRWDYLLDDIDYEKLLDVLKIAEKSLMDKISADGYLYEDEDLKDMKKSLSCLMQFTSEPSRINAEIMLDHDFNDAILTIIKEHVI